MMMINYFHTAVHFSFLVERGNYISLEGYLPDGEMWFSEPLAD